MFNPGDEIFFTNQPSHGNYIVKSVDYQMAIFTVLYLVNNTEYVENFHRSSLYTLIKKVMKN